MSIESTEIELCCQKNEDVDNMSGRVFVDNMLSCGYRNGANFV